MIPVPRSIASFGGGSATSTTGMAFDVDPVAGDHLFALVSCVPTGKAPALAGWVTLDQQNASGFSCALLYKLSDGSETGDLPFAWSGNAAFMGLCVGFNPEDLSDELDVRALDIANVNGSVTTQPTGTTAVTEVAASLAVTFVVNKQGNQFQNLGATPWSNGFTNQASFQNTSASRPGGRVATKELSAQEAVDSALTTTSAGGSAIGFIVVIKGTPTEPTIEAVDETEPREGDIVTFTVVNAGAVEGTFTLNGVEQEIDSWSDTEISIVATKGTLKFGVALTAQFITDGAVESNEFVGITQMLPPTGWDYVDIVTLEPTSSKRITAIEDLADGDQLMYQTLGGSVVVTDTGAFSVGDPADEFLCAAWTPTYGYGASALQTVTAA